MQNVHLISIRIVVIIPFLNIYLAIHISIPKYYNYGEHMFRDPSPPSNSRTTPEVQNNPGPNPVPAPT